MLDNAISNWTGRLVPAAAEAAGLSASDVPALLKVVGTDALATSYNPAVVAAVDSAVTKAYAHGVQ